MEGFKNFSDFPIDVNLLKNVKGLDNTNIVVSNIQRMQNETMQQAQRAFDAKRDEELRRHDELVSAIKSAAANGATIVIGDNASEIQIQQNTKDSNQKITNMQTFDYEKILNVLKEIKGYFDYPQFATTFNDNSELVKQIVNDTIKAAEKKEEPTLIKKSLYLLKDLAVGASGSLIASGILTLLTPVAQ
jgi:hypothetical protein